MDQIMSTRKNNEANKKKPKQWEVTRHVGRHACRNGYEKCYIKHGWVEQQMIKKAS